MSNVEDIFFKNIIEEAKNGEVFIFNDKDGDFLTFNIGFNTCIEGRLNSGNFGDSKPVLMIHSVKKLLPLLEQYVEEVEKRDFYFKDLKRESRVKAYLSFVWANAIYEDFANPYSYLKKQIDFLKDNTLDFENKIYSSKVDFTNLTNDKNKKAIELINNSDIVVEVSSQDIRMETPYLFNVKFQKEIDGVLESYELPSISYGISNGECFIYSILDKNNDKENRYAKSINRVLYALNKDVLSFESDDYKEYTPSNNEIINQDSDFINGDIPENISQVSPSAIISLTVFLDILKQYNIDKVKVVSLLPVRYNAKEETFQKKYEYHLKKKNLDNKELEKLLLEYKREQLRIQMNLSEKLIRNFRRLEHHFENSFISSYPMELDEYLHFRYSEFINSNNLLLNDILDNKVRHHVK